MEELHRQVGHQLAAIAQGQSPGLDESTEIRGLDTLGPAQFQQLGPSVVGHGEDHPLLGLGDPDLGIGESGVLQRGAAQLDLGAELRAHLADGRAESAGAAVGDGAEEAAVGAWTITSSTIFSVIALPIWTAPPETSSLCAVNSAELNVAPWMPSRPGPPADGHDPVAGLDRLGRHPPRQDADRAAEDERVGQVSRVDRQGAVDRGDAHAVAVVAHPGDDALEHPPGVQDPGRDRFGLEVGPGHAEHVGIADRPGAQPSAQRIADDAAQARVRPPVGIDRGRVVMRLDLEADVVLLIEADDARVVAEDTDQPFAVELARRTRRSSP